MIEGGRIGGADDAAVKGEMCYKGIGAEVATRRSGTKAIRTPLRIGGGYKGEQKDHESYQAWHGTIIRNS